MVASFFSDSLFATLLQGFPEHGYNHRRVRLSECISNGTQIMLLNSWPNRPMIHITGLKNDERPTRRTSTTM